MFEWFIPVVLAIIVLLFGGGHSEGLADKKVSGVNTVGLRKTAPHIPMVRKEDSPLWSSTPGLKSALKPAGSTSGKKKNIKWADRADYRAITSKGKITDKTVKIQ